MFYSAAAVLRTTASRSAVFMPLSPPQLPPAPGGFAGKATGTHAGSPLRQPEPCQRAASPRKVVWVVHFPVLQAKYKLAHVCVYNNCVLTAGCRADRQSSPNGKHYLWPSSPSQRQGSVYCRQRNSRWYQRACQRSTIIRSHFN